MTTLGKVAVLAGYGKRFGMLREPQHERKILNDIKTPPFVLSTVEGLRRSFSAAYWRCHPERKAKDLLSLHYLY